MSPGEVRYRDLELEAGDFIHLMTQQLGLDVMLRLRNPEGEILHQVDSPNGSDGSEELAAIVQSPGTYRLEIVGSQGPQSSGEVVLEELSWRDAMAADRDLVRADRAYRDAKVHLRSAEYRQAIEKLRAALEVWGILERPDKEAGTRLALCQAHHRLNQGDLAAAYCDQAIELYRRLNDRLMTGVALNRAGVIRLRLGQVRRSLAYFEDAVTLFHKAESYQDFALTLANLGTAHHRLGDYRKALDHLEQAIHVIEEFEISDWVNARVLVKQSAVLLDLNQAGDALDCLNSSGEIYRQLKKDRQLADVLNRAASASSRLGQQGPAEADLNEAIEILRSLQENGKTVDRDLALSYLYLSRVQTKKQRFAEAHTAVQAALTLSRRAGDRQIEGGSLMDWGRLRVLEGKPVDGMRLIDQASTLFSELEDVAGQAIARVWSAKALQDLGRFEEAWRRIEPALDAVERLRGASDRSDIRTGYFAFRQEFFETAIDLLMGWHLKDPEVGHHIRALEVHERRRARELLDVIAETAGTSRQTADRALLAEEHRLEKALRGLVGFVPKPDSDAEVGRLIDRLREIRGEIRHAVRRQTVAKSAPVGIDQIQQTLVDDDSHILVYSLGEQRSYLWSISSSSIEAHELPARRVIEDLAHQLVEDALSRRRRARGSRMTVARELSRLLLAPAMAGLEARRLVVVPSGALQRIPFAVLPAVGTDVDDDYLIRSYEIVVLPSISSLISQRNTRDQRPVAQGTIAAFADPVFHAGDSRVLDRQALSNGAFAEPASEDEGQERRKTNEGGGLYQRLEYTRQEVESILNLVPASDRLLAVDFAAKRENFVRYSLADYRILHFATHAFQNLDYPELSGLVLSLVDEQGRSQEGVLRAFEISRLELPVELVVLSACTTGTGASVPGEGIMGLTRAFFGAGAERVVSSLWPVSDHSTAKLMTEFYRGHLGAGLTPAAALRRAQLKLLGNPDTSEPFHWAGFIFQGEWHQIDLASQNTNIAQSMEGIMADETQRAAEDTQRADREIDDADTPASLAVSFEGDVSAENQQELAEAASKARRGLLEED